MDECPPVSQLREWFTPEQVRQWPADIIFDFCNSWFWQVPWVTDLMRWMIEECRYPVSGEYDFFFARSIVCPETPDRIRLLLKHGARFQSYHFHSICEFSYHHSIHRSLLLLIDYGHQPSGQTCWAKTCDNQIYCDFVESRRLTHRCVIALLGARRTSPLARRYLPRDILRMIAERVWKRRWDFLAKKKWQMRGLTEKVSGKPEKKEGD